MATTNSTFWNLAQAAAWVVFRKRDVVAKFEEPSTERWSAFMMYDSQWPSEPIGELSNLRDVLIAGTLAASGRPDKPGAIMEEIPQIEWESLHLDPPDAYYWRDDHQKDFLWKNIRVRVSDVLAIWPDPDTKQATHKKHGRKNWNAVDRKLEILRKKPELDLGMSDRELANRLQRLLTTEFPRQDVPGDRTLRKYISDLRADGKLPKRN